MCFCDMHWGDLEIARAPLIHPEAEAKAGGAGWGVGD